MFGLIHSGMLGRRLGRSATGVWNCDARNRSGGSTMVRWDYRLTGMATAVALAMALVPKDSGCAPLAATWCDWSYNRSPLPKLRGAAGGRRAIHAPIRTRTPGGAME